MKHRSISYWAIGCLFAALSFPGRAAADPIQVTGGALDMGSFSGVVDITGERGFSLSSRVDAVSGLYMPWFQCGVPTCRPGTEVSLLARWSGSALNGRMTFEGETYDDVGGAVSFAQANIEFLGSFIAPAMAASAIVMAPFQLSGTFEIPNATGTGSIRHTLFGLGTATVRLSPNGSAPPDDPAWLVASARYEFAAAEPVPEPGTLLLVGLGAATVIRRVRRSKA